MSRVFTTIALSVIAGIMFSTTPVMAKGWMSACKADIHAHCKGKKGNDAKECLKTAEGVSDACKAAIGGGDGAAMKNEPTTPPQPEGGKTE
jgi:hypothetical protein